MTVAAASAEQLAAMRRDASDFQAYVLGRAATAVLARYAFWEVLYLGASPGDAGLADVTAQNLAADVAARSFAKVVAGLNDGSLELVHSTESEQGSQLTLGVMRANAVPKSLGMWPIVPIIIIGAAAYGGWVLVNAWLSVRKLEAENDALRARTAAAVSAAVVRVGATDPQAAAQLADALERANNAASNVQPGLLDKLAGAVGDVGKGVRDSAGIFLLLGAAWLWSRRRAA